MPPTIPVRFRSLDEYQLIEKHAVRSKKTVSEFILDAAKEVINGNQTPSGEDSVQTDVASRPSRKRRKEAAAEVPSEDPQES